MRNAGGHQGENEGCEKTLYRNTYNISFLKRVTRKFLEISRCSRKAKKKCAAGAKLFSFVN